MAREAMHLFYLKLLITKKDIQLSISFFYMRLWHIRFFREPFNVQVY